jgi:hypothetical protein
MRRMRTLTHFKMIPLSFVYVYGFRKYFEIQNILAKALSLARFKRFCRRKIVGKIN